MPHSPDLLRPSRASRDLILNIAVNGASVAARMGRWGSRPTRGAGLRRSACPRGARFWRPGRIVRVGPPDTRGDFRMIPRFYGTVTGCGTERSSQNAISRGTLLRRVKHGSNETRETPVIGSNEKRPNPFLAPSPAYRGRRRSCSRVSGGRSAENLSPGAKRTDTAPPSPVAVASSSIVPSGAQ